MQRQPLHVRLIAIAISCVVSGLGLLSIFTQHSAGRWTRFGYAAPADGAIAVVEGLSIFFFGLLPLMLLARSPKGAAVFGTVVGTLGVLCIFVGIRLVV